MSSMFTPALASTRVRALLLALPLGLGATLAQAQAQSDPRPTDLQRVEVSGHRPANPIRHDVRASCAGIDQALQAAMAPAVWREARPGLTRVDFRLQDGRVLEVRTAGGPREYRMPIRRAVHGLDCKSGTAGEQLYSFLVQVRMDDAQDRGYQVALLQP